MCPIQGPPRRNGTASRARVLQIIQQGTASTPRLADAVHQLGRCTERGNAEALGAALTQLSHPACSVQLEAIRTAGRIAALGDERTIEALLCLLTDASQPEIRGQAADSLRLVTPCGNVRVVPALCVALCGDPIDEVRGAAARALAEAAERGNEKALDALLSRLVDTEKCEDVRNDLTHALGKVASVSSEEAVAALLSELLKGEMARRVAAEALEQLFSECDNCQSVLPVLMAHVEEKEKPIQELQLRASGGGGASPSSPSESHFIMSHAMAKTYGSPSSRGRSRSRSRQSRDLSIALGEI
mmetsp:Transcript_69156/g.202510  ORF Transcript_69156/g.202510 Transcript_69156/m.202510 type:complete len:301 (+) Transcript_69156:58-960(+)